MSGAVSYHAGKVAEHVVAEHYRRSGYRLCRSRWRGQAGEIDLILSAETGFVFVEVKKSRDFARAADRLTHRQLQRVFLAAQEFLGSIGQGLDTPARIDVALVNAIGEIEILENVMAH